MRSISISHTSPHSVTDWLTLSMTQLRFPQDVTCLCFHSTTLPFYENIKNLILFTWNAIKKGNFWTPISTWLTRHLSDSITGLGSRLVLLDFLMADAVCLASLLLLAAVQLASGCSNALLFPLPLWNWAVEGCSEFVWLCQIIWKILNKCLSERMHIQHAPKFLPHYR